MSQSTLEVAKNTKNSIKVNGSWSNHELTNNAMLGQIAIR